MNNSHDDFDLQDLWQKTPPVDVDKLMQSVIKAQKGMRKLFYYELGGTVLGLLILVWAYFQQAFGDSQWVLVLIGVGCVLFQGWTWTWRRELWSAIADSPRQLLAVRRKHLLLDIKIARSCYLSMIAGAVTGAVLAFFDKTESTLDLTLIERGSILFGIACAAVAFLVWSIRKEIVARKKLKVIDKKIKEIENEESL